MVVQSGEWNFVLNQAQVSEVGEMVVCLSTLAVTAV